MAAEGSGAQGNNCVLVKDFIRINRGELIQGFTVEPFRVPLPNSYQSAMNSRPSVATWPRVATINIDGWSYPDPSYTQVDCPEIRTLFYPAGGMPRSIKSYKTEKLIGKDLGRVAVEDPWQDWAGYDFMIFCPNAPIGVHLGEFVLGWVGSGSSGCNNLYTKILLIDGRIGYLVFETEDRDNKKVEII